MFIQNQFGIIQNLQMSPIAQISFLLKTSYDSFLRSEIALSSLICITQKFNQLYQKFLSIMNRTLVVKKETYLLILRTDPGTETPTI